MRTSVVKLQERAFTKRLQQLKEESIIPENDPLMGRIARNERQEAKRVIANNSISNRHARDIATANPWTGSESVHDSALRSLVDKHKPLKSTGVAKKIEVAMDTVIDYRMRDKEQNSFRELYREKFTPIGSFDKIKTIADQRIDEAMRAGAFDNLPRGQHHDKHVPIDRTEYHLNDMLARQNAVPVWIDKQGNVNKQIHDFREELIRKLEFGVSDVWLETRVKQVNSSLRSYNLQAPLSTQKLYLLPARELERAKEEFAKRPKAETKPKPVAEPVAKKWWQIFGP